MAEKISSIAKEFRTLIERLTITYTQEEIEQGLVLALGAANVLKWLDGKPELKAKIKSTYEQFRESLKSLQHLVNNSAK